MQRASSPIPFPNTYRDSNDISTTTKRELALPSAPPSEHINLNPEPRRSIIRPVEADYLPSSQNDSPNQILNNIMEDKRKEKHSSSIKHGLNQLQRIFKSEEIKPIVPPMKSIIRSRDIDDEKSTPEQIYNGSLINDDNSILEAAGYDSTRLAEVDADAEYALRLQEEEYSRESLMPNRHHFLPFQVEPDNELAAAAAPSAFFYDPDNLQFTSDEQYAAYLQEQQQQEENRTRQRRSRAPIPSFLIRQHSNPVSTHTLETDETSTETVPPQFARFAQRQALHNEDESDEDNPYMNIPHPFFQFLANRGRPLPEDFPAFLQGLRGRGHRRSGNLQDTEEDFGPEDYERLLQLDDTIHKKKLSKDQINSIPLEQFRRTSNNSDEENKCGVCLELFQINQTLRRFPCRHIYHKECGDRWLQENNVCPICREPPVKAQSTTNSRHTRGTNNIRRPPHTNRNSTNRNNNPHRKGPPFHQRPS